MKISVIIVSYNTGALLRECLNSVFKNLAGKEFEVFVVDNASVDDSVAIVRAEFPQVCLIANTENVGFAAANNQVYDQSKGEFIFLVNPDSKLNNDAFGVAIDYMKRDPHCGGCGVKLVNEDGCLEPSARKFPNAFSKFLMLSGLGDRFRSMKFLSGYDYKWFDHESEMQVDWVPGTFVCYRRKMLEEIGFFDDRFYLYYEETDLCLRAKKQGWSIYFVPGAEVMHIGGASSKTRDDQHFDAGGSQVLKFRMRAECLYFRKNHSIFSVLTNMGIEWMLHLFRRWLRSGDDTISRAKRTHSFCMMSAIKEALVDTRWGRLCPPKPWV